MSLAPHDAPLPAALPAVFDAAWSLRDLQHHLGDIPLERIRAVPSPGAATEADALRVLEFGPGPRCELIDGVLVEKPVGFFQSLLAAELIFLIRAYLEMNDIGRVLGEQGPYRILKNQLRVPDVSFIGWQHFPNRTLPKVKVLPFAPDLAVEILSEANTTAELVRKRREYFAAGTRLMWIVEPELRTADVYRSPDDHILLREHDTLTGGDVLPGFELVIREWFERVGLTRDE